MGSGKSTQPHDIGKRNPVMPGYVGPRKPPPKNRPKPIPPPAGDMPLPPRRIPFRLPYRPPGYVGPRKPPPKNMPKPLPLPRDWSINPNLPPTIPGKRKPPPNMPQFTGGTITNTAQLKSAGLPGMPAYTGKAARILPGHRSAAIGSVPRTQFYLASSGDYTPEALSKIYQTPTRSEFIPGDVGGDYTRASNSIRLNSALQPVMGNYVMRHEASHMFDRDQALNRGKLADMVNPRSYSSEDNGFAKAFDEQGNYMPYDIGRSDVVEKRAAVSMEPGRYKGLEQFYPEFTPEAWKKKIPPIFQDPRVNRSMPAFVGATANVAVRK